MTFGDVPVSPAPRNRAERRAERRRVGRKGLAAVTGASLAVSGWGLMSAAPAGASTYQVTTSADSGAGSLRQAILDANGTQGADEITFDPSVETILLTTGQLSISDSVSIIGPGVTVSAGGASRVIDVVNSGATTPEVVTISGLTITGGHERGGGIRVTDESLQLTDVTLTGNTAAGYGGGGLYFNATEGSAAVLTVEGSTFHDNTARWGGGLAVNSRGTVELDDVTVTGNTATNSGGGGAYLNLYGTASFTITDSTFGGAGDLGNTAYHDGGGLYAVNWDDDSEHGTLTITGSTIVGNETPADGGGIKLYGGVELSLDDTTVSGNDAGARGGGLHLSVYPGVTPSISNSTITDNVAQGNGGGVSVYGGTLAIAGSTISGNTAGENGGAIASRAPNPVDRDWPIAETGAFVSLSTSTVTGNNATTGVGDGIVAVATHHGAGTFGGPPTHESHAGAVGIDNSIVSGNGDEDTALLEVARGTEPVPEDQQETPTIEAVHSLVTEVGDTDITATAGNGNIVGQAAELAPLASNGGTTQTHLPAESSPTVDAGDPGFHGTELDQRGEDRVSGAAVDMGSVELQQAPPPAPIGGPAPNPPTTTPPTTRPTAPPRVTAPPTSTPAQPPAPSAPSGGGSSSPTFIGADGESVQVPLPPSAPAGQVTSSVAVSATESIAVTADGRVFSTNPAHDFGQVPQRTVLNAPMVGLGIHWTQEGPAGSAGFAAASVGDWVPSGYWLVGSDGGVFTFGTAKFRGSTGARKLNQPIVSLTPTASGLGYWLVAADGGVFTFGDATFHGSTGALKLAKPVVSMVSTSTGKGYWLVASDGGVFTFGDARFFGSGAKTGKTFSGAVRTATDAGYWLLAEDGTKVAFGDAS